jgi:hypothetical protein
MKFLFGLLLGIIGTLGFLYVLGQQTQGQLVLSPEKGQCITKKDLIVFQVIGPSKALVRPSVDFNKDMENVLGMFGVMLLVNDTGETYYDDEIVKVPAKTCARQIGTYQYPTRDNNYKTVPVVRIESI